MYRPNKDNFKIADKPIKGVVYYFHPTIFGRNHGPSNRTDYWNVLGALYATQNYVFVASDELGYNSNNTFYPHPYILYPQQMVKQAISALNFTRERVTTKYLTSPIKLFTAGYSEGAGYSIWFSKCFDKPDCSKCDYLKNVILDPEYKVTRSAGLEGAYDLTKVQFPFLTSDVGLDSEFRILNQT